MIQNRQSHDSYVLIVVCTHLEHMLHDTSDLRIAEKDFGEILGQSYETSKGIFTYYALSIAEQGVEMQESFRK